MNSNQWMLSPLVPQYIKPLEYDILIEPDLDAGVFTGKVVISLKIEGTGSYIPVHVKNLEVTGSHLSDETDKTVSAKTSYCEKNQFFVMSLPEGNTFHPGLYKIVLSFKGSLMGKIVGLYKSSYLDETTNSERKIATTKFEPVDARQAFPCFDEPSLKAKFKIRIVRPKDQYSALSNMNVLKEEPGPGPNQVTVHFPETVPMSTYLVCFIVSDFKDSGVAMVDNKGTAFPVKIYSTPGQVQNTLFSKVAAASVVKFYIDYFDIPYALPKLDLIAIPDFVSGAMENWGLITFRETGLLFNEKENSAANKQRVATVVSHEISHQWFGNLVTMKWWDDLWLNEGFASFMQYKGVEFGIPECKDWQMLDQAIHEQIQDVMKSDALNSSHPIIQPVNNPNQITEIFDKISYSKGHAVIRMLEGFMGEEKFRTGVQKYLKEHVFGNAATPDLWAVFNKELGDPEVNVQDVMDTWTRQMGLPLINVKNTSNSLVLTQERFLSDGQAQFKSSDSPYGYKWDIPVHYVVEGSSPKLIWFNRGSDSISIPLQNDKKLIKLNHKQLGYYRVNYDVDTWMEFDSVLKSKHERLDRVDRANLLDDAFNLAGAGRLDYGLALEMTGYLQNEREFLPWATASDGLFDIIQLLSSSPYYPAIRQYVRSLVGSLYGTEKGQFSWNVSPEDSHIYRLLRIKILSLACYSGLPACLNDVGQKFLDWIKNPETEIHPDVRSLIYRYGMSVVGKEYEWDALWKRYLHEKNVQEKINMLRALAAVKEPWLLSRYVELSKNETNVRSQDYFSVLGYISSNPVGNPIVWKFYRNEWPYLVKRFSLYHRVMGTFISTLTSGFSTEVELEEVEAFYAKYPDAGAGANARKAALDRIKQNMYWLKKNEATIGAWLQKKKFL
ncbi:hypothetical protein RUM43_003702 [Polyplax serrata]|uniref:Aminopeptidase n=1 Tax=Polyplax serrata TaxID=468196 RepID=A0AAN8P2X0_POLSC